ncbi:glycohydrolase toxin TNT-related protein [Mycolicibacterium sp. J2]|uniref:glycohydrolase toxin TNT-related protein n=1 Tax=Mycolicibacterium sp. J2 TaxID=2993511 RepID=UPI00224B855C|nr:glycohydrolase toxin TNT-related protein [Mycolicibacterium sp. J2]MCX2712227.1 glycohydrolase toxin TNT-related protein [Mycolicibacterium sp. J2]
MTAPIAVDPAALSLTGVTVDGQGQEASSALNSLAATLSGAGAQFGHDAAAIVFSQSYIQAGQSLLHAATSAVNACRKIGYGVQMSASNYGRANAASTVGGGESPVPPPQTSPCQAEPSMPPAMGDGIAAPLGWSLVEAFVGDFWPDGNPGEMRATAAAWRTFGTATALCATPLSGTAATLSAQQIPEAAQIAKAIADVEGGMADIGAQAQTLANQVEAFAGTVETTQNAIRGLLQQLSPGGILETLGGVLTGHNPLDKIKQIAGEIKIVLHNMKREADAMDTIFNQGINLLDSATNSLENWANKEFIEAFGEDVGNFLSMNFNALVDLPEGGLKFLAVTAQGLEQLDPTRLVYDPQGALKTWEGVAESTAALTNPALLAEKVISDPQGSLNTVKSLVDWEDVENGHPFRALGYDAAQVGTMLVPGAGEAAPAVDAASAGSRVAGAEARAGSAGAREAATNAAGRVSTASEGVTAKAGEIGSKLDGITVPDTGAGPGATAAGRAPGDPPVMPETKAGSAPVDPPSPRTEPSAPNRSDPLPTETGPDGSSPPAHESAGEVGSQVSSSEAPKLPGINNSHPSAATPAEVGSAPHTQLPSSGDSIVSDAPTQHAAGSNGDLVSAGRVAEHAEASAGGSNQSVTPHGSEHAPSGGGHEPRGGDGSHDSPRTPSHHDADSHQGGHHSSIDGQGQYSDHLPPSSGREILSTTDDAGDGWHRIPDDTPAPNYGEPLDHPGTSDPLEPVTDKNRQTWELFRNPEEVYGHDSAGNPLAKEDYDLRYRELQPNGATYDNYPPNAGAVPGTRVEFDDMDKFINHFGADLDRIGDPSGKYLGLRENGIPATFEERSLPIGSLNEAYYQYHFTGELPDGWKVEVSEIAPGLGRDGGGIQVLVKNSDGRIMTIEQLMDAEVLE